MISRKTGRVRPWTECSPAFPAAGIKEDDIAWGNFDALHFLQSFEVLPVDGRTRFKPTLWRRLSRQTGCIEQDAPSDDPIFQSIDASSRTAARCLDLLHRHTVVSLALGHDVAIH